ncbi:sensor histidine kinase [Geothrix paludis]|uniref:sensor histidine kinase n=1 Tax=Geothrix paludis TaxID=2922722 RepID=UPI001FACFDAF|nr:HAMP domain-containing sensor histidine kinase [Geothrix paludis]
MQEVHLFLIFVLATFVVVVLAWLSLFSVVSAKSRVIREQRKALEAEQRLRLAQEAFMDNAHHELRTPVQVLAGHLQMARDLSTSEEQVAILDRAQETATRLGHLVQGLLDFASLAQGTLTLRPGQTDLGSHLAQLGKKLECQARAKGLEAKVALDPLLAPLVCDAARLSQALEALLDNAVGFTERGTVSFRMVARPEGRAWRLRFEIEDQGPGLPPDWERLLRPFEQEERSLRRQRGGLGIGLPLAAGIVHLMGGQMGLIPLATGTLAWAEIRLEEAEG